MGAEGRDEEGGTYRGSSGWGSPRGGGEIRRESPSVRGTGDRYGS